MSCYKLTTIITLLPQSPQHHAAIFLHPARSVKKSCQFIPNCRLCIFCYVKILMLMRREINAVYQQHKKRL